MERLVQLIHGEEPKVQLPEDGDLAVLDPTPQHHPHSVATSAVSDAHESDDEDLRIEEV